MGLLDRIFGKKDASSSALGGNFTSMRSFAQIGNSYVAGLQRAAASLGTYAAREVLPLESLLGHTAYLVWLVQGQKSGNQTHFAYPNHSARETAVLFMAQICTSSTVVRAIRLQVPSFLPDEEIRLAELKTDAADWMNSVTRNVIMLCRTFAYQFCGLFDEGLDTFVRKPLMEALTLNLRHMVLVIGPEAAAEIHRLSVERL